MIRSFIDSGVLIAAARGQTDLSTTALRILAEKDRAFASSIFIQLETQPKATFHKQQLEAKDLAVIYGLGGMDALHIAAALLINADQFVTTEKITKPMHRVTEIQMVSIARN